jgi:ribonuclease P protein component
MKKTVSIKSSRDFSRTFYRGKSFADKFIVVYVIPNKLDKNRIGISIGKKIGCSVVRNKVKRLIRESYRKIEEKLKFGFDIVFVPRHPSKDASFSDISNSINKIFDRLAIIDKDVI